MWRILFLTFLSVSYAAHSSPLRARFNQNQGFHFDRLGYVAAVNDRFFELYGRLFESIANRTYERPEMRADFDRQLAEINHLYYLRASKLQPEVDLAWYQAMRSLHELLAQKTGRKELRPVGRVAKVNLNPALWAACPALLEGAAR